MINNLAERGLQSFEEYSVRQDYEFFYSVFENFAHNSVEEIVLSDRNLKILYSNSKIVKDKDDILKILKVNCEQLGNNKINFVRSIVQNYFEYTYKVLITPIFTDEEKAAGYLFILRDISDENYYKKRYLNLVEILKHELNVSICAQTMVSKLLAKKYPCDELALELYNSCNDAGKILQNNIFDNSDFELVNQISPRNVYIKTFINNVFAECKSFLQENNNRVKINNYKNKHIFIDTSLMKSALIMLIRFINKNCGKDKTVIFDIDSECIKIEIKIENFIFPATNYLNSDKSMQYVKSIISAHNGSIIINTYDKTSVVTIYIPKNKMD